MRLELLSQNLISIINRILYNEKKDDLKERQVIAQLLNYSVNKPYSEPILTTKQQAQSLFMKSVFPYSTDTYTGEAKSEIRVYYPDIEFDSTVMEDTMVVFDIVVHESLYLMRNELNKSVIRPLEIAKHLIDFFDKQSFDDTIGTLKFERILSLNFDNGYQATRLIAKMMTIGNKE